jgi:hypothetical protein
MNDIGIIETLKKVLEFYAKEEHYKTIHPVPSVIDMDRGNSARVTLTMIKSIEETNLNLDPQVVSDNIEKHFQDLEKLAELNNSDENDSQ